MKNLQRDFITKTSVDIAEEFEHYTNQEAIQMMRILPKEKLAEVFYFMEPDVRNQLLDVLTMDEKTALMEDMESDQLVDILQEVPANIVSSLLNYIPSERRREINQLLQFEEESVGSLMTVDFIKAKEADSKQFVLDKVKNAQYNADNLNTILIVDDARQLIGYVDTIDLIRSEEEWIEPHIQRDFLVSHVDTDQEEAAKLFTKYHLMVLPVLDRENRLVGVVTADDIFQVIEDELYEDMAAMQGMQVSEQTYLETSAPKIFKGRITWLLILMITATFTGIVIQRYDEVLAANALLAAYIPMLMDSGGNSGSQASATIIRAISQGEVKQGDWKRVLWKEIQVGVLVAIALMTVNFIRVLLMDSAGSGVALTVSVTLAITIVLAKITGAILPMIADFFGQDPAVMTGPLLTTVVDTLALLVYFEIASVWLGI